MNRTKRPLIFFTFLLFTTVLCAQELRLAKGKVIDSIAVNDTLSYALYLPTKFDVEKKWPIIFAFDPAARGRMGVSPFIEAAEEHGFVLVCSNNSKNGISYEKNTRMFEITTNHVFSLLPIDLGKIYVTGFSGGARLATTMAVLSEGKIKGVIGCGAGFANNPLYYPTRRNITYIGVVGERDFNYNEMKGNRLYMNEKNIGNELIIYDGDHRWPPSTVINLAVGLLLKKSLLRNPETDADKAKALALYNDQYEFAALVKKDGHYHLAYNLFQQLNKNYRGDVPLDSVKAQLKQIRKLKPYKEFKRSEQSIQFKEEDLVIKYSDFYFEDLEDNNIQNIAWWKKEFEKVEVFKNHADRNVQNMGHRLYGLLFVMAIESTKGLDPTLDVDALILANEFLIALNPSYHNGYIELMRHYSTIGKYDFALGAMEELLKNGYTNEEALSKVEGIALLRIMPEYKELLDKY